jgi:hypothetical protein
MEPEGDLLGKGHVHSASASASEIHLEPEGHQAVRHITSNNNRAENEGIRITLQISHTGFIL